MSANGNRWHDVVEFWAKVEALRRAACVGQMPFAIEVAGRVHDGKFKTKDLWFAEKGADGQSKLALRRPACQLLLDVPLLFNGFQDSVNLLLPGSNLEFGAVSVVLSPDAVSYMLFTGRVLATELDVLLRILYGRFLDKEAA